MRIRDEWKWMLAITVVCVLVFANSTGGEFIYDDLRQILRNPLIQDNNLIWQALTSDVWAFKGGGEIAASNYWRPTFTAWNILNFRLFGNEPFGWHITNILLHSGVCVMAFGLLRRWKISAIVAFAITLIFAVHPVHAESIAWISGSPDLLFALAFLASLWFAQDYSEDRSTKAIVLSAVFYAVALGAKEIGILCFPIFYFIVANKKEDQNPGENNLSLFLFGGIAAGYFLLRLAVLGAVSRPPENAVGFAESILSAPAMFVFYLKQIVFPVTLSINYPLSAVNRIGVASFIVPLVVSLVAAAAIIYAALKDRIALIGAMLFFLPLFPVMYAAAFTPEQIVHDRYLYLPLLGFLIVVFSFSAKFLNERSIAIAAGIITLVFGFQTIVYNQTFSNNITLWANAVSVDGSAFSSAQYGSALLAAGRFDDAAEAFTVSINSDPQPLSLLGRGRTYAQLKKYAEAEVDLKKVIAAPLEKIDAYSLYLAYESLGLVYSEQQNYAAAIENFEQAREKLPIYKASITAKLAVVLYQSGQKQRALAELESVKEAARTELLPDAKAVFLRLGMLYAELGRKDEAKVSLQEFIKATATQNDRSAIADRNMAQKFLDSLE